MIKKRLFQFFHFFKTASLIWLIALVAFSVCQSCYSFRTAGIPPGMESFYIAEFDNTSSYVVATLAVDFTQKLLDKVRIEGKLTPTEYEPDVEFSGTITTYNVTSVAPEEGQTTAFNRLEIAVRVAFKNNMVADESKDWQQTFRFFEDFDSNQNLLDVQDELIETITDQLVEDIFNKAFSDW